MKSQSEELELLCEKMPELNAKLHEFLAQGPSKKQQRNSQLPKYFPVVKVLIEAGKSYSDICSFLKELGVETNENCLRQFVWRRKVSAKKRDSSVGRKTSTGLHASWRNES